MADWTKFPSGAGSAWHDGAWGGGGFRTWVFRGSAAPVLVGRLGAGTTDGKVRSQTDPGKGPAKKKSRATKKARAKKKARAGKKNAGDARKKKSHKAKKSLAYRKLKEAALQEVRQLGRSGKGWGIELPLPGPDGLEGGLQLSAFPGGEARRRST